MVTMDKFAIVEINKSQYMVAEGDSIDVAIEGKSGEKITFDKVLLNVNKSEVVIGKPYIEKATVKAEVIENIKGEKVKTLVYRAKTRYRKRSGNRQKLTTIKILKIS